MWRGDDSSRVLQGAATGRPIAVGHGTSTKSRCAERRAVCCSVHRRREVMVLNQPLTISREPATLACLTFRSQCLANHTQCVTVVKSLLWGLHGREIASRFSGLPALPLVGFPAASFARRFRSSQASAKQEIEQMGQAAKAMGVPQSRRLSSRAGGGRAEAKSRSNSLGTGEPISAPSNPPHPACSRDNVVVFRTISGFARAEAVFRVSGSIDKTRCLWG